MPTYGYRCSRGHHWEVVQRITEAPLTQCAECGSPATRVFYPVGIVFKGQGFYKTDSRGSESSAVGSGSSRGDGKASADGKASSDGKASGDGKSSPDGKSSGDGKSSTDGAKGDSKASSASDKGNRDASAAPPAKSEEKTGT
ncbi:MAG TPA: FmdB family zinc ribbon protein [Candidatus Dormibacteraeota bacterium]|jgi:putative FmdB family regulatory protein